MSKKQLQADKWFRLTNMAQDASVAELQLFGYIGEYDQINYQDLIYAVEQLPESVKTLKLIINSQGGEVYEGNAICIGLQMFKRKRNITIETHIYTAASMGGVVALVGDKIVGYTGSVWHAHEVKGGARGNAKSLRQMADHMESLTNDIAERYSKRTGIDAEVIKTEWLGDGIEKYFMAQEALEIGLYDEVIDLNEKLPEQLSASQRHEFFNKILNVAQSATKTTDIDMDFKAFKNKATEAGLTDLVAVENEEALVAYLATQAKEKADLRAQLDTATSDLEASQTELDALKAKADADATAQKEAKALALVDRAIEEKRIVASQKDIYLAHAKSDFEACEKALKALSKPIDLGAHIKGHKTEEDKKPKIPLNKTQETLLKAQKAQAKAE